MNLVHAQLRRHGLRHPFGITGEHDGLVHTGLMQGGDGLPGVGLHHVGDDDVTGVLAVHGHVDDGADAVTVVVGDAKLRHELAVAGGNGYAVHHGGDAVAAELLHLRDAAAVDGPAVGLLQALADGVGGGAFGQRRVFQQLGLVHFIVMDGRDLEHAPGQGAGLVKHHALHLRQRFQIVGALDKDALLAGTSDTGKKAQGDADHQRTGAAGDEERQGAVDPLLPLAVHTAHQPDHRRQHRQCQRTVAHGGGVDAGELGDEVLGAGLAGAGVLHQLQDLGHGGLAEGLGGADLQQAGHVDAAADDLVALAGVPGQALAGKGAGVQGGGALGDDAVDGHLLAGLHHDDRADSHLIGIDLHQSAVLLDIGVVRADVHQGADVFAALAHGVALEQLADLVEQHDGDSLVVVAALFVDGQRKSADGGHGHQEVLVEYPAVEDALPSLLHDVVADDDVCRQIQRQPQPAGDGDKVQGHQHHRRDEDAEQHLFLLLCHGSALLSQ